MTQAICQQSTLQSNSDNFDLSQLKHITNRHIFNIAYIIHLLYDLFETFNFRLCKYSFPALENSFSGAGNSINVPCFR